MKAIYVYKAPQDFAIAEKVAEFLDTRRIPTFKRNSTFFLSNSWYLLFICGSWHICIDNEAKSRIYQEILSKKVQIAELDPFSWKSAPGRKFVAKFAFLVSQNRG